MGSNAKCNELMAWVSDALTRYVSNRKDEVSISVRLLIGEYLLLVKSKGKGKAHPRTGHEAPEGE
jgi:hypothetical protein